MPLNNILHTDMSQRFIIYGVVIYALNGVSSIPIIQECLGADKKKLPHLIIGGGILCMILAIAW